MSCMCSGKRAQRVERVQRDSQNPRSPSLEAFDEWIWLTDAGFVFLPGLKLEETPHFAVENAKEILRWLRPIEDLHLLRHYPVLLRIQKHVAFNQAKGIFSCRQTDNISKIAFPAIQALPACPAVFPAFFKPDLLSTGTLTFASRGVVERLCWMGGCPAVPLAQARLDPWQVPPGSQTKMSASIKSDTCCHTSADPKVQYFRDIALDHHKRQTTTGSLNSIFLRHLAFAVSVRTMSNEPCMGKCCSRFDKYRSDSFDRL